MRKHDTKGKVKEKASDFVEDIIPGVKKFSKSENSGKLYNKLDFFKCGQFSGSIFFRNLIIL